MQRPPGTSPSPSLPPELAASLRAHAARAADHAYAPYSHFFVGAALLLDHPHAGQIVTGCNVENASYRLCTCAEQTAIARAVAELGPSIRLRAVAVSNRALVPCTPCGACRQTLREFAPDPAAVTVLFPGQDETGSVADQACTLADLLPSAFALAPL